MIRRTIKYQEPVVVGIYAAAIRCRNHARTGMLGDRAGETRPHGWRLAKFCLAVNVVFKRATRPSLVRLAGAMACAFRLTIDGATAGE